MAEFIPRSVNTPFAAPTLIAMPPTSLSVLTAQGSTRRALYLERFRDAGGWSQVHFLRSSFQAQRQCAPTTSRLIRGVLREGVSTEAFHRPARNRKRQRSTQGRQ